MIKYETDKGPVTVELQSENFYLCSQPAGNGHTREVYTPALFYDEAARKAIRFWYNTDPKFLNRI